LSKTHTHAWATAWTNDATYHWHACTGDGATDACLNETGAAKAEHTYGDTGDARFTCTVCEYVDTTKQAEAQAADLADAKTTAKGELDTLDVSIPRAEAAASEAEHRIALRRAELDAALMDEMNKRSIELASLRESLSAGSDRVTRTELRSPVRGTVKQIYINTVGGVVKPGESIMEIVPLNDTLLVEARVRPQDVAFLHPGQKAMVKVSAYDFSIYGGLDGVLEQISADTIEDKRGEFYYLVKVRTPRTAIEHNGESLPIMPGMMTTVDILTGKKTVLDYLLKPILKAKQNALREK
jgi:adhesin transport system membrane fusion protein